MSLSPSMWPNSWVNVPMPSIVGSAGMPGMPTSSAEHEYSSIVTPSIWNASSLIVQLCGHMSSGLAVLASL